jgi:hypothetical protein
MRDVASDHASFRLRRRHGHDGDARRRSLSSYELMIELESETSLRNEMASPPLEVLRSRDLIVAFALEEQQRRDADGKRGLDWLVAQLVTHVRRK